MGLLAFLLARSGRAGVGGWRGLRIALLCLFALPLLAVPVQAAELQASSGDLLSPVGSGVQLRLQGTLDSPWPGARLRVQVSGPQAPSAPGEGRPVTGSFEQDLGELPASWERAVDIPAELVPAPGAYRLDAIITSGPDNSLADAAWLGKTAASPPRIDLASVWPLALGVQRDAQGAVLGEALEQAVTPEANREGSLYAFFTLADSHPDWHFTLAVEPLLLSQIQDMTDGYTRREGADLREVAQSDQPAVFAAQALTAFRSVAALDTLQVIPMPFASPHLPLLAAEEWPDGLDQMQLGKSQLVEHLQLTGTPDAAYPPGLELTTESLGYFSGASIDYALAAAETSEGLAELPENAEGPVRVRDASNNRLTLVFVNAELRRSLTPDWNAGLFFAALASEMAAGKKGPFVTAPSQDYVPAPGPFLQQVADELGQNPWISTRTLAELMAADPPSTRPIFLSRYASEVEGFVGEALAQRLRESRALADDYLLAADPDRAPVDSLKLLLYQAESRFWFARGVDPRIANRGLSYLNEADRLVREEFDKVDVVADKSVLIMGDEGEIPIAVMNRTGYPFSVTLGIEGEGLQFEGETSRTVTLGPQENIVRLPVKLNGGTGSVKVALISGSSRLEEEVISIRAVSLRAVLPWVLGVAFVAAALIVFLLRRRGAATRV